MDLKIKNIILYPKDKSLKPRIITFKEDKVNVISGFSQKGKSAIISIIDYCLASSDCNIPIGLIREKVDKFAIYIALQNTNIFIARNSPDHQASTDIMFFQEIQGKGDNPKFNTNEWIEEEEDYKVTRLFVKNYLNQIAGFENISEEANNEDKEDPASIRDTVAFLFQPQNIIANPTTIFYKTDTFAHLRKLKSILPLVLGYKSYQIIKTERELELLEQDHQKLNNKYENLIEQYNSWKSDVYLYYTEAIYLGLTTEKIDIQNTSVNKLRNELLKIISEVKKGKYLKEGSSLRHSEQLNILDKQRQENLVELKKLKFELYRYEQIDSSKNNYFEDVLLNINDKLKPISWFLARPGSGTCPFCDSKSDKAINELLALKEEQDRIKPVINNFEMTSFSFEKEKMLCKRKLKEKENQIQEIEKNINILLASNVNENKRIGSIFEFIGKIENIIENLTKLEPSSDLMTGLNKLAEDIQEKQLLLTQLNSKFDKNTCLFLVSKHISKYVKLLPIEDKENKKVLLDPDKSVSIKIEDTKTRYNTFLSKIGSGANHMCYHLATLLGFHDYFISLAKTKKRNYIPSFLILDQPSQVYFPQGFGKSKKNAANDQDIKDTKAIFTTCSDFMKNTNCKTQIIILEHAPETIWTGINHIYLVENWREEVDDKHPNALIPKEWLD